MRPDITPAASEPAKETVDTDSAESPAEAPLAEPPKNLEFTEVPPEEPSALPVPPAPKIEEPAAESPKPDVKPKQTETKQVPEAPAAKPQVANVPPPKKAKGSEGPKGPGAIIFCALLIFVALAVVAVEAYSKSK